MIWRPTEDQALNRVERQKKSPENAWRQSGPGLRKKPPKGKGNPRKGVSRV
jgi:hypothetical protein